MTNSPAEIALTLASLLNAGEKLPALDVIRLVRTLAAQVADVHSRGQIYCGITPDHVALDADRVPALRDAASVVPTLSPEDIRQYLPPELKPLSVGELPAEIVAAREKLQQASIPLDPCQIDIYSLGVLLCRLLTGESVAAYLRSARVKRDMPIGLRPIVERALGSDGRERFRDVAEFAGALDIDPSNPEPAPQIADENPPSVSSGSTGDTKPSFVQSPDTKTWISPAASPGASDGALPFTRLGHYDVVDRIGRGGMGDVYLGYEQGLDRKVAIKVLPADLARQSEFVRRFKAEATAAARLVHPNIIQIYFIGEDAGNHFFAMQYVAGESVADLLHQKGKLNVDEAIAIVEQALAGLNAAHKMGLVHRDIKPGNILLDRQHRRALLADFGLVKSVDSSGTGYTATGVVMGTVDYISPEQGRGQAVDGRSDLYSFGVLLFQLLSGKLPFEANSPTALIFQHVYERPPSLTQLAPHVPASLAAIIAKLMRKAPADRHQTGDEVLADLRAFRQGQPLPSGADRQSAPEMLPRPPRSSMIFAPESLLSELPTVAYEPTDVQAPGWWEQAQNRAKSLFWRHAPEVVQRLQNTSQQIDAAAAHYARQERELRQIKEEAESVINDLLAQAREHRQVSLQAGKQAANETGVSQIHKAQGAEIAAQLTAAELERQAAEQRDHLDAVKVRLAQIITKRRQLENQRDILNARLKMAGVRVAVESGRISPKSKSHTVLIAGGLLLLLLVAGSLVATFPGNSDEATLVIPNSIQSTAHSELTKNKSQPDNVQIPPELLSIPLNRFPIAGSVQGGSFDPSGTQVAIVTANEVQYRSLQPGSFDPKTTPQVDGRSVKTILSPDWKTLAVDVEQGASKVVQYQLQLHDVQTGTLMHLSERFEQPASTMAISPDGQSLAAIHVPRKGRALLRLWSTKDMITPPRVLQAADYDPRVMSFDPRGRLIASGTSQGQIHFHNLESGHWVKSLTAHTTPITALAFGPDGKALISGDNQGHLLLWDVESGQNLGQFPAHRQAIESLAIAPNGYYMASSDASTTLLWDMSVGVVRSVLSTQGKTQLAFDPQGKFLLTTETESRTARIWKADLSPLPFQQRSYSPGIQLAEGQTATGLAQLNPSEFVFAAGKKLQLFDRGLGTTLPRFPALEQPIRVMSLSNDRQTVVTGSQDGNIHFWNATNGKVISQMTLNVGADGKPPLIGRVAASPDGRFAAVTTDSSLFIATRDAPSKVESAFSILDHISALAWDPDVKPRLLITGRDPATGSSQLALLDLTQQKEQFRRELTGAPIDWLSFLDGSANVLTVSGGIVRLMAAETGIVAREWKIPNASRYPIALSPNGTRLAVVTDQDIGVWDPSTAIELGRYRLHAEPTTLSLMTFSADSQTLATLSKGGELEWCPLTIRATFFRSGNNSLSLESSSSALQANWVQAAVSPVGRESLVQNLDLARNPDIHIEGPSADAGLQRFSTDGGWWINQGGLIRKPGAKRVALDMGQCANFNLELASRLVNTGRLFIVFGWNGKRGYSLSKQPYHQGGKWILSSFLDGQPTPLSISRSILLEAQEMTHLFAEVRNGRLALSFKIGDQGELSSLTQELPNGHDGRVLIGMSDAQPDEAPLKLYIKNFTSD
ncbi:MAG: prkC 14 [Planctomycetaceae bacterium]|nr:prkC 14 [Planctomycetaceae bacterium]